MAKLKKAPLFNFGFGGAQQLGNPRSFSHSFVRVNGRTDKRTHDQLMARGAYSPPRGTFGEARYHYIT